jgi:hypothetical protein
LFVVLKKQDNNDAGEPGVAPSGVANEHKLACATAVIIVVICDYFK